MICGCQGDFYSSRGGISCPNHRGNYQRSEYLNIRGCWISRPWEKRNRGAYFMQKAVGFGKWKLDEEMMCGHLPGWEQLGLPGVRAIGRGKRSGDRGLVYLSWHPRHAVRVFDRVLNLLLSVSCWRREAPAELKIVFAPTHHCLLFLFTHRHFLSSSLTLIPDRYPAPSKLRPQVHLSSCFHLVVPYVGICSPWTLEQRAWPNGPTQRRGHRGRVGSVSCAFPCTASWCIGWNRGQLLRALDYPL